MTKKLFRISKVGRLFFIFKEDKCVGLRATEKEAEELLERVRKTL